MDRSLKLARQTPQFRGFLTRIRPVPGEIHPLRPPLTPGATVVVQNHRRLVLCEETSAPTPLDPLLASSASAPCVGPAEATSSRAPLPLTRSSDRARSPVLGPDPRKAQPVPTHLLLSTERAKARKSSESVRSVRIRSTTLVRLLHGLNLLPSRISEVSHQRKGEGGTTAGWKANPVEFDSVFNQSRHTISFGSPDIVPIFCSSLPHSTWGSYPHEYEDFATDASFLDHWSFDQFEGLLNRSLDDVKLRQLLLQDKLVIFLHLLGCDSNGHAHRPYSSIYLNNVKVVDEIAERMYNLMESYFNDNRTAYVFTADHGMSDKGSHGDGHPSNTDTPLVAWGAGIRSPKFLAYTDKPDDGFLFVDDHRHDMPTPQNWALEGFERVDVNQADIAPLMATLVGLPCPLNSVGNLPSHYLKLSKSDEVEAVLANTKQILNQFLRKSEQKQSSSLYFKPFKPLVNYSSVLDRIEDLISARDYETAMKYSEELRSMALAGLHYFQTYDWFMLMTTIILGYIGWMANLVLHVLQSYTTFPANLLKRTQVYPKNTSMKVYTGGCLFMGLSSIILLLEKSPPLYHAYVFMTIFLWTRIVQNYEFMKSAWRELFNMPFKYIMNLLISSVAALLILEFLVMSFFDRKLYTWCFLALGILASVCGAFSIEASPAVAIYTWLACWFLSVFTLMPAEIPENNNLVIFSGALIILIAMASRWATINTTTFWLYLNRANKQAPKSSKLFFVQVILISVSSIMVWLTTSHRSQHKELHPLHQLINWCVAEFRNRFGV